jgi:CheY-like chemotaxis protein
MSDVQTLRGLRVVFVDDDAEAMEPFCIAFEMAGAAVKCVTSCDAALDTLRGFRADVLVADLAMPNSDGFELIRRVRADTTLRTIPTVAFTASASDSDREKALAAGFDEFVPKPTAPDVLIQFVAQVVSRHDPSA